MSSVCHPNQSRVRRLTSSESLSSSCVFESASTFRNAIVEDIPTFIRGRIPILARYTYRGKQGAPPVDAVTGRWVIWPTIVVFYHVKPQEHTSNVQSALNCPPELILTRIRVVWWRIRVLWWRIRVVWWRTSRSSAIEQWDVATQTPRIIEGDWVVTCVDV